jgi:hypothetical protein
VASRDELTLEGELTRLIAAEPFEPFSISVTSGERFNVGAADRLIVGQNVATLVGLGDGSIVIRKNQIVAVDSTSAAV